MLIQLRVKLVPGRDCFVSLPSHVVDALFQKYQDALNAGALEVKWVGASRSHSTGEGRQTEVSLQGKNVRSLMVSWAGSCSSQSDALELSPSYAECLGLSDGIDIDVHFRKEVPVALQVLVEPVSTDDWELVELNCNQMESQVLNQARAINVGYILPIWLSSTSLVRVKITDIFANDKSLVPVALLSQNTEVVVKPKEREAAGKGTEGGKCMTMRVLALEHLRGLVDKLHPSDIFVPQDILHRFDGKLCSLRLDEVVQGETRPGQVSKTLIGRTRGHPDIPSHHVVLGCHQRQQLLSPVGSRVQVRSLQGIPAQPAKVVISPVELASPMDKETKESSKEEKTSSDQCVIEDFEEFVRKWSPVRKRSLVLLDGTLVELKEEEEELRGDQATRINRRMSKKQQQFVCIHMQQADGSPYPPLANSVRIFDLWYDKDVLRSSQVDKIKCKKLQEDLVLEPCLREVVGGGQELVRNVTSHLLFNTLETKQRSQLLRNALTGGVLLVGQQGSGKSFLARAMAHQLSASWAGGERRVESELEGGDDQKRPVAMASACSVHVLHCGDLCEADEYRIHTVLEETIERARQQAPAVLLLDDIDSLAPAESQHGSAEVSSGARGGGRTRTSLLIDCLRSMRADGMQLEAAHDTKTLNVHGVAVLGTAKSLSSLSLPLLSPGLFDMQVEIPPLDRKARKAILCEMLGSMPMRLQSEEVVDGVESSLEGYSGHDLRTLADRVAVAVACRRLSSCSRPSEEEAITAQDLRSACEGYVPPSLKNFKSPPTVQWEDIAGMDEAKDTLLRMIQLPTRHPELFAAAPLRVRTGCLLYGHPGCGKTFLVGGVASKTGLNFITVKGPELLNKYIGASEQGVRDVFARASAAKPCLLFFDEFDSIAPQRGHDSTGVTDRVVNQFLTALDGIEGLSGVFVVAATSRPELIDAALLRPGRLDKHICCPMPDNKYRLRLLQRVASKAELDKDICLEDFAEQLEGCSCADLQAFIYNAQLLAIHDMIDGRKEEEEEERPRILLSHLQRAAEDLRPSLSEAERRRYDRIYESFQRSHKSPQAGEAGVQRKATMA